MCTVCAESFDHEANDEWGNCHGYYFCGDCWEQHEDSGCTRSDCPFNVIRREEEREEADVEETKEEGNKEEVCVVRIVPILTVDCMMLDLCCAVQDTSMPLDVIVSRIDAVPSTLRKAIDDAREWARANNGMICITGSLYLAGEALQLLRD